MYASQGTTSKHSVPSGINRATHFLLIVIAKLHIIELVFEIMFDLICRGLSESLNPYLTAQNIYGFLIYFRKHFNKCTPEVQCSLICSRISVKIRCIFAYVIARLSALSFVRWGFFFEKYKQFSFWHSLNHYSFVLDLFTLFIVTLIEMKHISLWLCR